MTEEKRKEINARIDKALKCAILHIEAELKDNAYAQLAAENKRLREALEKAAHAHNCAIYDYDGTDCSICGVGEVHANGSHCLKDRPHQWQVTLPKDCNCLKAALAAPAQETEAT